LRSILEEIIAWRPRIGTQAFLADWESSLAFRGEWVQVVHGNSAGMDSLADTQEAPQSIREEGVITGLERDGSLCLRTQSGKLLKISAGEIHLRLANSAAKTLQPT
jgi:biotin-(acetyl-CoA carboxylase) ligase